MARVRLSEEQKKAERFVRTWERSRSAHEAAAKLDKSVKYVCQRANVFRGAGLPLQRFRAGRPMEKEPDPSRFAHLDLERLRALLRDAG